MKTDSFEKIFYALAGLVLLGVLAVCIAQPHFEAATFNRLTNGPEATYWDAVFSNLRITGCN